MSKSLHPFFYEIKNYPELSTGINFKLSILPQPYYGKNKIKAILLGADPTNNGIKSNPGLKPLEIVFGIGSEYEKYFFGPQNQNLKALQLTKDDFFIQNICRNYFMKQTTQNIEWSDVAMFWLKYLKEELAVFDKNIPILVTAEKILKVLIPNNIAAITLYRHPNKYLPFNSDFLQRDVFPLFRHPKYYLSVQQAYKNFLKSKLE